jgi:hypothetical protein
MELTLRSSLCQDVGFRVLYWPKVLLITHCLVLSSRMIPLILEIVLMNLMSSFDSSFGTTCLKEKHDKITF